MKYCRECNAVVNSRVCPVCFESTKGGNTTVKQKRFRNRVFIENGSLVHKPYTTVRVVVDISLDDYKNLKWYKETILGDIETGFNLWIQEACNKAYESLLRESENIRLDKGLHII